MTASAQRSELLGLLASYCDGLNDDEVTVLCRIAERLHHGQQHYGALTINGDGRNFAIEAHEELMDATVYAAILCEQMRRR